MVFAVIIAFVTGICLVVNRIFNAQLGRYSSPAVSCAYNYITGLITSLLVLAVVGLRGGISMPAFTPGPIAFTGGLLGLSSVLLLNITVGRIPEVYLSLLTFVGQVYTAVVLDVILSGVFSPLMLVGGTLVAAGLCYNVLLDHRKPAETAE